MLEILDPVWTAAKAFFMFFHPVLDFIVATKVPEQIDNVDYKGLFTNAWFMVPYLAMLAWDVYKQAFNSIIIVLLLTGCWAFFGTPYMKGIMAQDEIDLNTILPLVGGACTVLGIIVYRIFFKSE
jgi:hypothetical protein